VAAGDGAQYVTASHNDRVFVCQGGKCQCLGHLSFPVIAWSGDHFAVVVWGGRLSTDTYEIDMNSFPANERACSILQAP